MKDRDDPAGVPLTEGEIAFVKSIFGNSIKDACLRRVRKHYIAEKEWNFAAEVIGRYRINFYPKYHEEDYSVSKDPFSYGAFIHEMTHIWQNQGLLPVFFRLKNCNYDYGRAKSQGKNFRELGSEQQASVIEDYARRFLFPEEDTPPHHGILTSENDAWLQKTVETQFPAARSARLKMALLKKEQEKERLAQVERAIGDVKKELTNLQKEFGTATGYTIHPSKEGFSFNTEICDSQYRDERMKVRLTIHHTGGISTHCGTNRKDNDDALRHLREQAAIGRPGP